MKSRRIMSEAIERVLARVFKGLGCVLASLGAILASLGAPFGGSAALLGANMAEESNKRAKKSAGPHSVTLLRGKISLFKLIFG